jgi:hypothetical protein
VDTIPSPLDAGTTSGDGSYTNETTATVTATAAVGFAFTHWSEHGQVVSRFANYTFTNIVNRSLVAAFVPVGPLLNCFTPQPGTLVLTWPTNEPFVLERNEDLSTTNWVNVTNAVTVVGTNKQVTITPMSGPCSFYRLMKP